MGRTACSRLREAVYCLTFGRVRAYVARRLRIGWPRQYTAVMGAGSLAIAGQDATLTYTPAADTTPNAFTFTGQTGVAVSTVITSAAITISGLGTGVSITLNASGGSIDKNGNANFLGSQIVTNGDTVRARVTSSASNSTGVSCAVVASPSGVQDAFTATTLASSSFAPLQHFSFDSFTTGTGAQVSGQLYSPLDTNGSNTGSIVSTANPRSGKAKHARARIAAGTSGFPADGETPAANGFWGWSVTPPASAGASKYGRQGDWFHYGFWMYIASGQSLTTNITDGALKFLLNCFPTAVATGKDDFHICGTAGFGMLNEIDPNNTANNSYPSTRSGTDVGYTPNQWCWFERGTELQSNGDLAVNRLWTNNNLILERDGRVVKWRKTDGTYGTQTLGQTGAPSIPNSTTQVESFFIFSYWNAHPSTNVQVDFDDITTWTGADPSVLPATDSFGNKMIGMGVYP
jgi:hypothetical protein